MVSQFDTCQRLSNSGLNWNSYYSYNLANKFGGEKSCFAELNFKKEANLRYLPICGNHSYDFNMGSTHDVYDYKLILGFENHLSLKQELKSMKALKNEGSDQ